MFGPSYRLFRLLRLFACTLGVYALLRLAFLAWNWEALVREGAHDLLRAFGHGLRFDLSALAFLFLPLFLLAAVPWPRAAERTWRQLGLAFYLLVNLPLVLLNVVDLEFVNFVGRRMSAGVLFLLREAEGKVGGFVGQYWILMLLGALVAAAMVACAFHAFLRGRAPETLAWYRGNPAWRRHVALHLGLALPLLVAAVLAARGGLQAKPLSFVDANRFASSTLNAMSSNTSFSILQTLTGERLARPAAFRDERLLLAELNGAVRAPSLLDGVRPASPQNVVLIVMESFGLDYLGKVNGVPGYTPFLDELAEHSLFFPNGFANGRRSIEGIVAILAGIPALMETPFVTSPFAGNRYSSLGGMLAARGYHTSFFHGGGNGTMYFDSFARASGIAHYHGADQYPDPADHDGAWGIYDEPYFQYFLERLNGFPRPFFATIFSLSSHQPYRVPDRYRAVLPSGRLEILQAVAYGDLALRRFFEAARRQPWYQDTLFVITADHAFQAYLPDFDNEPSRYRIPLLFHHPRLVWPAGIDTGQVVQQIDILPSVLDFLGIVPPRRNYLARSVFVPGRRSAIARADGRTYLFSRDYFLSARTGEAPRMYRFGDFSERRPLTLPADREAALRRELDASLQYFAEGMLDNRIERP